MSLIKQLKLLDCNLRERERDVETETQTEKERERERKGWGAHGFKLCHRHY